MSRIPDGWRNFRESFPLAGWLYLGKLFLSLIFTLPLLAVVSASLDNSAYATVLLKTWSLDVIFELVARHREALPIFVAVLAFFSIAVFLFKQFLNGGIYYTFLSTSGLETRAFFAESAALFGGNLKVSLFLLFLYAILAIVSQIIAGLFPDDIAGHFGAAATGGLIVHGITLYLFLISGSILSDILRFRLAAFPDQKFAEHLRPSINFYLRRFVKLHSIYYLYFVPMVILWLIIENTALLVTGSLANIFGVFIEMVLFQVCAFVRTAQSLLFVATVAPLARESFRGRFGVPPTDEAPID